MRSHPVRSSTMTDDVSTSPLKEVARLFVRLGTTAFGGPAAHIAMMEDEVVRRRRWKPGQTPLREEIAREIRQRLGRGRGRRSCHCVNLFSPMRRNVLPSRSQPY